jgi:hypothetical protein
VVLKEKDIVLKENFILNKMFLKALPILSEECRNIIPH